jgi:nucleoside-diphosphate-sugar epimerase
MVPNDQSISIIGCGYIGKRLARRLLDKHYAVTGIVSSETSLEQCQQQNIPCKLIDLDQLHDHINPGGQRIIYLAPPPNHGQQDTRVSNLLNALEHPPEKFVLISTTGVYGDCKGDWIDETTPLNPTADRAHRRIDLERQVQAYCHRHQTPLVILRVAGIYGPGKLPLKRIQSGQPIVSKADSPYTNRIHADDLVSICERALLNLNIEGVYNVTDGHPSTMYDYFNQVAAAMSLPAPPAVSLAEAEHQLSPAMMSYMAESRRISNHRLLNDFELDLRYPTLAEGLQQCLREDRQG